MSPGRISGTAIFGLILMAAIPVFGQTAPADSLAPEAAALADSIPADYLVLPPVNYSEKGEAHSLLLPLLYRNLDKLGVTFTPSDDLRPLLREHRIRSRGWIGLEAAQILRRETRAKFLILVSWDIFRAEENPEIGLSLRVLDLENMTLVSASSVGLTGADFTKAMGLGRIWDVGELAEIAVERAISEVLPLPETPNPRQSIRGCFKVALIPFDNYSQTSNAGEIITNIVLSRLLAHDYFVVEPGFIRELGLTLEVINRGGVDGRSASSILANFGACRVITGEVEKFTVARGDPTLSVPELALGIRVMSPLDLNLYMMEELLGAGDDGEGMFQGGRMHALVPLANRVLQDFLDDVAANNRKDILYGENSP
jgi:hypothetical protein